MNTAPSANEASPDVYEVLLTNDHAIIVEDKKRRSPWHPLR